MHDPRSPGASPNQSPAQRALDELAEALRRNLDARGAKLVLVRARGSTAVRIDLPTGENLTLLDAPRLGTYVLGANEAAEDGLPSWLDATAWREWSAYRASIRKPIGLRTQNAQWALLKQQHDLGLSQRACIEQSIRGGWVGLFPARGTQNVARGAEHVDAFVRGGAP